MTLFLVQQAHAQEITVKVISKTVEKTFTWKPTDKVKIEGEKAKLSIKGWEGNEVKVIMKQISKARTQQVAEKELAYQRYIFDYKKGTIYIKNYFAIPKGTQQMESIQKVEFQIWIPRKTELEVYNNYGNTHLERLSGSLRLNTKYGNIDLNNYSGSANVKSYFGDLTVTDFAGSLHTDSNHTLTILSKMAGDVEIQSILGDVIVTYSEKMNRCKVLASKADVTINHINWKTAFVQLATTHGDLLLPNAQEHYLTNKGDNKIEFKRGDRRQPIHIDIQTSFGKIIIP